MNLKVLRNYLEKFGSELLSLTLYHESDKYGINLRGYWRPFACLLERALSLYIYLIKYSRINGYPYLQQGNAISTMLCEITNLLIGWKTMIEYAKKYDVPFRTLEFCLYIDNILIASPNLRFRDLRIMLINNYRKLGLELHQGVSFTKLKKFNSKLYYKSKKAVD